MSDVVVIGAGANGLTTAVALARTGKKVVVLEARAAIGGLAGSFEFHPGYFSAGVLSDTSMVRPAVLSELELHRYQLKREENDDDRVALGRTGRVRLGAPGQNLAESLAELEGFLTRVRPVLRSFNDDFPIDVLDLEAESTIELLRRGLRLRRLGRRDMLELLRVAPMCIRDWLLEYLGESDDGDLAAAALALPSLTATYSAPRSPGGCANFLLLDALRERRLQGGTAGLIAALERAAQDCSVEIRTDARVAEIEVASERAVGVKLASGESVRADVIAVACDPRTALLDLVHPKHLSVRLSERLTNYRCRGTTAHLLVAVRGQPELPSQSVIADGLDDIERAFDSIKYGELPKRPVLELSVVSDENPDLCADGDSVLSALVHFVPSNLRAGPFDDGARATLTASALARIFEHAPSLRDSIVATHLSGPADLERDYGLAGGNLHHGERAIDQLLVRPVPECSAYATPIDGLFLCGGGTHPGGGLHAGNGRLAARAILNRLN